LVAAAGSGKTSTIVGKVGYALLTGLYKPEEILVLAFNKNAGEELSERINFRLKDILTQFDTRVEALNFHKFGVKVIGKATGKSPSVSNDAGKQVPPESDYSTINRNRSRLSGKVSFI
jgi:DNA helicase-4